MVDVLAPPAASCANCGNALTGPYCATCGQKDRPLEPGIRDLAGDVIVSAFDIDGRLLRSLRFLLTRPGFLTAELFAGRRARYVSPFRLYLAFSLIAFTVAAYSASRALVTADGDVIDIGMGQRVFLTQVGSPEERQEILESARTLIEMRTTWLPRVMFALIPLAALVVMCVTWGTGHKYPQHFYFTLHLQAVIFAGMTLIALMPPLAPRPIGRGVSVLVDTSPQAIGSVAIAFALVVFATAAFRRVYGGGWIRNTARTSALVLVYGGVVMTSLYVMLFAVLAG
jgi:hypothetical protein